MQPLSLKLINRKFLLIFDKKMLLQLAAYLDKVPSIDLVKVAMIALTTVNSGLLQL